MNHRNRINTLKDAGLNTDRYLSLRIDKSQIPEGAEVVFQIRDRNGNIITKPVHEAMEGYFGKSSRFYAKVMADGHIFNPYIHRRFLPAQFRRNIRSAGYNGIREYVRTAYGWNYVTRFLSEECWKLSMLQRRDPLAFQERSRFFPLSDMRLILCAYADAVTVALNEAAQKPHTYGSGRHRMTYYLLKGEGSIRKEHLRPMKHRFAQFKAEVSKCLSYTALSKLLENFDFCKLDSGIPVCDTFVTRFLESGAYYTLKQMIMFEGVSIGGTNVTDDLRKLAEYPQRSLLFLFQQYDK